MSMSLSNRQNEPSQHDMVVSSAADDSTESHGKHTVESTVEGATTDQPYSSFTPMQKRLIIALAGSSTLVSPLAATMYLPLLPLLSVRFNVNQQAVNLTITVYIVCQALSPLLFATVSDTLGRRPIYLATFLLFTIASLGLALNTSSYAALLVLRALQSFGASAVLSISYGTVADICTTAERGKMLGPLLAAGNLGTCIGPIVGGWIALSSGGFRWAFWALAIFGGIELVLLASLLPETARKVVGDGSVVDRKWNRPLLTMSRCHNRAGDPARGDLCATKEPTRSLELKSPLTSIRLMFYPDTALILWLSSSSYALWYCVQASIPSFYKAPAHYSFDELQVGLAYLPGSVGVILSMYLTGKIMDRNYAFVAKREGLTVNKVSGDDLTRFPIEIARGRGSSYLLVFSGCVVVGYGWVVDRHGFVAIPLILQFILGYLVTMFNQTFSALLVDIFPEAPSTAATAGNLTKCALSAAFVAVLQPLCRAIGVGWFFSILGFLTGVGGLAALMCLNRWGMQWRTERQQHKHRTASSINKHTVWHDVQATKISQSPQSGISLEKTSCQSRDRQKDLAAQKK